MWRAINWSVSNTKVISLLAPTALTTPTTTQSTKAAPTISLPWPILASTIGLNSRSAWPAPNHTWPISSEFVSRAPTVSQINISNSASATMWYPTAPITPTSEDYAMTAKMDTILPLRLMALRPAYRWKGHAEIINIFWGAAATIWLLTALTSKHQQAHASSAKAGMTCRITPAQ